MIRGLACGFPWPGVQDSWNPRAFSCGGRKSTNAHSVPAGEMYCGSYHAALRRAADALAAQDSTATVLVLSARHGLVALDEVIAPYDLRMGDEGSVTGEKLRRQASDLGVLHSDVTVLGPRKYVEAARGVWPRLTDVLAGAQGIGEQLAKLADIYTPGRRSPLPRSGSCPAGGASTVITVEEMERRAHARQNREESRASLRRARYATYSRLVITHTDRAYGTLTFPGDGTKNAARAGAASRFASLYHTRAHRRSDDACTMDVDGTPRHVAHFLSALPRLLEKTESRASEAARLYSRWERHSAAHCHLADVAHVQRRSLARDFRAAAFQVVVDVLLDRPDGIPEVLDGLPPWHQVYPLAAGIARYYWFDPAALADPDETARILAAADRRHISQWPTVLA
ncbi:DUF6884 domain-containing protein [Streptomyces sp. NPDC001941]|uniref:DUF6884 domain-containing protein n=1 Tax=Streptomyces sp. NPDC001941 TaxID=3154659 RepID=UPI003326023A